MIDLGEIKSWLGIPVSDTSHDAQLIELEKRMVALIQRETGRYFGPVISATQILVGDGGFKLRLAEVPQPMASQPVVTVHEILYPGAEPTAIDAAADDGFELRTLLSPIAPNLAWLQRKGGCVWLRGAEYVVEYDHGYPMGEEPGEIRQAVLALLQFEWELRRAKGGVLQSETFDKYSYSLSSANSLLAESGFPHLIAQAVAAWQRPVW